MAPSLSEEKIGDEDPYGYGDAAPDIASRAESDDRLSLSQRRSSQYVFDANRVPRRSSLKRPSIPGNDDSNNPPRWLQCRRASMGSMPNTATEKEYYFQIQLRGSDKVVRRRRSIEFNNEVNVRKITPAVEEAKSPTDLWMQPEDFQQIKSEVQQTLKKFKEVQKSRKSWVDAGIELRGLENHINREDVRERRFKAWDAVLYEQDDQEIAQKFDDEKIAQLYRFNTLRSPAKAVELAQQDREAVKEYLSSPLTTKLLRRSSC